MIDGTPHPFSPLLTPQQADNQYLFLQQLWRCYRNWLPAAQGGHQDHRQFEHLLMHSYQSLTDAQQATVLAQLQNGQQQCIDIITCLEAFMSLDCQSDHYFWASERYNDEDYYYEIRHITQELYSLYNFSLFQFEDISAGGFQLALGGHVTPRYEQLGSDRIAPLKHLIIDIAEYEHQPLTLDNKNNEWRHWLNKAKAWTNSLGERLHAGLMGGVVSQVGFLVALYYLPGVQGFLKSLSGDHRLATIILTSVIVLCIGMGLSMYLSRGFRRLSRRVEFDMERKGPALF